MQAIREYTCTVCGLVGHEPMRRGKTRILCGSLACQRARAKVTQATTKAERAKVKLELVRTEHKCHGQYELACPRVSCDMNTAHEQNLRAQACCSVVLANAGGMAAEDIAEVMGVSASFVAQVEARALDKLRESGTLKGHVG